MLETVAPGRQDGATERSRWSDHPWAFPLGVAAAVVLGAVVRLVYVANFPTVDPFARIGGDGFAYSAEAGHFADGHLFRDFATQGTTPSAHHPPGWVTVLGLVSRLGFRSIQDHQVVTSLIGLVLIVLVALLARRVFGVAAGVVAAVLAGLYPGFWVLEAQVLSETLGLIGLVVLTLALYRLHRDVTLWGVVVVAVLTGLATLVRPELFATGAIVLGVVLVTGTTLSWPRRLATAALALGVVAVLIAPWSVYNTRRFAEPVLLSTNMGSTLLAGNCRFGGEDRGFFDTQCFRALAERNPDADRSQLDGLARADALGRINRNVVRLPVVVPARVGRAVGLYAPGHTVAEVARWHKTETWPVWSWVVSYWVLLPLAAVGAVVARRRGIWILPLVVPLVVAFGIVVVFYGEPRYHAPADAGVLVLAAFGLVALSARARSRWG